MGINTGALYIIVIILILLGLAYLITGPNPTRTGIFTGTQIAIDTAKKGNPQNNLQLITFGGATITPPMTSLCQKGGDNNHPELIIAYSPAHAKAVPTNGQIKVFANDDNAPRIAPAEQINRNSGAIIKPGDQFGKNQGYILEPAMYVFPYTVEKGGYAYVPNYIKGAYNNGFPGVAYGMDKLPPGIKAPKPFATEYIWNVEKIGLKPGSFQLQFVIPDGENGRAIGCITIRVYEIPAGTTDRYKIPI